MLNKLGYAIGFAIGYAAESVRINKRKLTTSIEYLTRLVCVLLLCTILWDCTPTDMPIMKLIVLTMLLFGLMRTDKTISNARL